MCRMVRSRRRPDEPWLGWFRRSRGIAIRWRQEWDYWPWGRTAMYRALSWGAHVARVKADRLLHHMISYRSLDWWRLRQNWVSLGYPEARHPAPFNALRQWEHQFASFQQWCRQQHMHLDPFGMLGLGNSSDASWKELAQRRDMWSSYAWGYVLQQRPEPLSTA